MEPETEFQEQLGVLFEKVLVIERHQKMVMNFFPGSGTQFHDTLSATHPKKKIGVYQESLKVGILDTEEHFQKSEY